MKALDRAFADTGKQKDALIDQMLGLKLDPSDVYAWILETSDLKEHVNTLDLKLNDVIRFFLWKSLNVEYQEKLISGDSRPNVAQILDNIYEAESRITQNQKANLSHDKSVNLAATMESSSAKKETLCDIYSDHKLSACPHYKTPEARLKHFKALKRCSKCSAEHETSACKFKFRFPCEKCKESSHLKAKKPSESKSKSSDKSGSKAPETPSQVTLSLSSGCKPSDVVLSSFMPPSSQSPGTFLENVRG